MRRFALQILGLFTSLWVVHSGLCSSVASLPVGKAVLPAQEAPGTASPSWVVGLLRQDSRGGESQPRSHTKVSSSLKGVPEIRARVAGLPWPQAAMNGQYARLCNER
jgi:hypothetical protein